MRYLVWLFYLGSHMFFFLSVLLVGNLVANQNQSPPSGLPWPLPENIYTLVVTWLDRKPTIEMAIFQKTDDFYGFYNGNIWFHIEQN